MNPNGRPALVLRLAAAALLLAYGLTKLPLPGHVPQFVYSRDWTFDARTGAAPTLVWLFFGYAPVYGFLIAAAEISAAVLLVLPRTVGALLAFAMMANVSAMDWAFGFPLPATLVATALALAALALLHADRARLVPLLGGAGERRGPPA
jgi:hypothetical protein